MYGKYKINGTIHTFFFLNHFLPRDFVWEALFLRLKNIFEYFIISQKLNFWFIILNKFFWSNFIPVPVILLQFLNILSDYFEVTAFFSSFKIFLMLDLLVKYFKWNLLHNILIFQSPIESGESHKAKYRKPNQNKLFKNPLLISSLIPIINIYIVIKIDIYLL